MKSDESKIMHLLGGYISLITITAYTSGYQPANNKSVLLSCKQLVKCCTSSFRQFWRLCSSRLKWKLAAEEFAIGITETLGLKWFVSQSSTPHKHMLKSNRYSRLLWCSFMRWVTRLKPMPSNHLSLVPGSCDQPHAMSDFLTTDQRFMTDPGTPR